MDKEKVQLLQQFIKLYRQAKNKEEFINMWEQALSNPDIEPYTLKDAYENAYGYAIDQIQ